MEYRSLNHSDVLSLLPERDSWGHKGDFGKILLLCGSRGYTGAAAMAAMGALRSGAGLVYLGVPECIYAIEAIKLTEPVVFPLPDQEGMLSAASADAILELLPKMDAVLVGCGLGKSEDTLCGRNRFEEGTLPSDFGCRWYKCIIRTYGYTAWKKTPYNTYASRW